MCATPSWDMWLASQWGPSFEGVSIGVIVGSASNFVPGQNPPYYIQDFLAQFPKWGGAPLSPAPVATITANNNTIVIGTKNPALAVGQPVAGLGIADGSFITAIDSTGLNVTLSQPPTASGSGINITVWNAPPIPFFVVQLYLNLAWGSLVQARWLEQWVVAMGLYIAHFLTLYALADGNPLSNIGQIAAQGLSFGITTSKAVGDVSVGYTAILGWEDWGSWNLTVYGQMLMTFAKNIGSGPLFCY